MTTKEFFRKAFAPKFWLHIAAMIVVCVAVCFGTIWWMESYTRHGEGVDVPNVKGKLLSDAQFELGEADLVTVVVDSIYDKKLKPGVVVEQSPGQGSRVKAGREIYLTVNAKTVPTLPLPYIINNCSVREAEAQLTALGFKLGPKEYIPGDKDWVLGVKVRGRNVTTGERIAIETPITLVVGNNEVERDEHEDAYTEESWTNEGDVDPLTDGDTGDGYEEIVM